MNTKAKGAKAERRAMRILETAGYVCTRASASLGLFDVVVPANVSRECWRFPDRCRVPVIEVFGRAAA